MNDNRVDETSGAERIRVEASSSELGAALGKGESGKAIREKALEILRRESGESKPPQDPTELSKGSEEAAEERARVTRPSEQEERTRARGTRPSETEESVTRPSEEQRRATEGSESGREPKEPIPARMLNEFVYCPRLFYYEYVEGVFVENADTLRGEALHQRVDKGKGALPAAKKKAEGTIEAQRHGEEGEEEKPETIHSRSVLLGSERLGVTAKMDLVEVRVRPAGQESADLFEGLEVCPVDYKAGSPREGEEANELWDTDKMQLGLQALILRDNGYTCKLGIIYYRGTKQRVPLAITPELEAWILEKVAEARRVSEGSIPAPLVKSPKCPRCSLVTVCLPDETRLLSEERKKESEEPRRLMAARDDRRVLYLTTQGLRVGIKDEVLMIKEKDRVVDEVRVNDVSHVALFGNIQTSTQAVQGLCEAEVPITYFSMGGWFYGMTRGHELKNVFLRMEQFRIARERPACLRLARQFVHGKIRNQRTMLMRNHLEPPAVTLGKLKSLAESALRAESTEELLGTEGAAANFYFQQFSGMIKVTDDLAGQDGNGDGEKQAETKQLLFNFNFTDRNRRPPTDPVNAMLSLAYSLLAKDCTVAALAVGFDPYVGFYHQPRFGRPALALDLMEEFRPLVAESTVLSCINNRVITAGDFVRAGKSVNLSAAGRKRFFQMYEQRMTGLLTHPMFEYKVSYRRALELQARILSKVLTGEVTEYTALMTR